MIHLRPKPQHLPVLATAAVLALLYGGAAIQYPGFASWFQFTTFFADNASLGLAAVGMTFVILCGGIDLSVGAVVALASIALAAMLTKLQLPAAVAIPLVLAIGAAFGAGMGALVRFFRLPPFLVTLAGMFLARGVALVLTPEKRLSITSTAGYDTLGSIAVVGLNLPALTFIAAVIVGSAIARYTRFGRSVYAIGGNESSAVLMGLPVGAVTIKVYALSGLCAALGGVMHAIHNGAGDAAEAGKLLELDAIAAVVIGGTLLSGGVGSVIGTLLGVLILAIVSTLPSYVDGLNSWWTKIFIGALLLAFIVLQRLLQRTRA